MPKQPSKTKGPGPDYLLAEDENAPHLNEAFYRAEPHEYFERRLYLVMLAGDPKVDLEQFLADGVEVDGFQAGPAPPPALDELEQKRRDMFLITEAASLAHHVGETLLRLYFAHASLPFPGCPWLELVRERRPAAFKERVRERFGPETAIAEERDMIAKLFYGTADHRKFPAEIPAETLDKGLENIERWLRFYANEFLEDAPLYNSVKHGLAVHPNRPALSLSDAEGQVFLGAEGAALDFLAERQLEDRRVWARHTRWVPPMSSLAATSMAIRLIHGLWRTARWRYLDEVPEGIDLITEPMYFDFRKAVDADTRVMRMSVDLSYYSTPQEVTLINVEGTIIEDGNSKEASSEVRGKFGAG
jgi:hypothetical protein